MGRAGRTGFGPLGTGNETDLTDNTTYSKAGVFHSVFKAPVQGEGDTAAEQSAEMVSTEVGKAEQVSLFREANSGMEVYRRRAGSTQGHLKGAVYPSELDLNLGDTSPGGDLMAGNSLEGEMEENPMEICRSVDREESPMSKNLKLAVEVSNYVGLSCDGQEGLKVECLK